MSGPLSHFLQQRDVHVHLAELRARVSTAVDVPTHDLDHARPPRHLLRRLQSATAVVANPPSQSYRATAPRAAVTTAL